MDPWGPPWSKWSKIIQQKYFFHENFMEKQKKLMKTLENSWNPSFTNNHHIIISNGNFSKGPVQQTGNFYCDVSVANSHKITISNGNFSKGPNATNRFFLVRCWLQCCNRCCNTVGLHLLRWQRFASNASNASKRRRSAVSRCGSHT